MHFTTQIAQSPPPTTKDPLPIIDPNGTARDAKTGAVNSNKTMITIRGRLAQYWEHGSILTSTQLVG